MKRTFELFAITAIALLMVSIAGSAYAQPDPEFYIRTNKASYTPGDTGQLLITIRNEGDQAFTVRNITVNFPWMSFIIDHWEGNVTVSGINQAIAGGAAYNTQQSFTVPADGRAYQSSSGTVRVGTDMGTNGLYRSSSFRIQMSAPTYTPFEVSTSLFSIILIGIMGIATVLLFTLNQAFRRTKTVGS